MLELAAAPALAAEEFAPHVQKAQTCYDAKDYDCAVRELQAAYQINPVPGLLLNIGHAHLDAGRPQEALTFYGLYLQSQKRLSRSARAEVEKFREQARARLQAAATPTPPANPTPAPAPTVHPPATPTGETPPAATPTASPPVATPAPAPMGETPRAPTPGDGNSSPAGADPGAADRSGKS